MKYVGTKKNGSEELLRWVKGLNTPKRTRQLVSYCLVAVIKLMEITRVGARQVKEKCREQGKWMRG